MNTKEKTIIEIDNKIEISKKQNYLVVKGNELIQKSRFELSLLEQKTIAYICSMIKPVTPETRSKFYSESPWQLEYEFNIREYCKVCGIDYTGGKNYKDIKIALKKLADRSMWLDTGKSEILMRWLAYVEINKNSEKVKIEIDRTIAPYLFELQEKFTQYELYNILEMKSAFSVRLYELLKSYSFYRSKVFELNELKRLLMVESVKSYNNFNLFKTKVLKKAQEEINAFTDINIYFEAIKEGKKVVKVKFRIAKKIDTAKYYPFDNTD